ncbi:MAG: hypothetical protein ACOYN0_08675 [Phycisphaerales bacterium]
MFAKFATVIVTLGAFAAGLLSLRQSRLQVASEITQCQLRIEQADLRLWKLRAQIAAKVTPRQVEELSKDAGTLRPLALPPLPTSPESGPTDPAAKPNDPGTPR